MTPPLGKGGKKSPAISEEITGRIDAVPPDSISIINKLMLTIDILINALTRLTSPHFLSETYLFPFVEIAAAKALQ